MKKSKLQQSFETKLRKKGDKQYKIAKAVAKAGIQSEYHTGEANKMVRKLDQEQEVYYGHGGAMPESEYRKMIRSKKLKRNIWLAVGVVVILLTYLILR